MIDPSLILKGPCKITHNSVTWLSTDDVKCEYVPSEFDISADAHGKVDTRRHYGYYKVSFTPIGTWALLGVALHGLAGRAIGENVLSDDYTDALVISPLTGGGQKITLARAALTKCPAIRLGVKNQFFSGPVEFTAIQPVSGSLIAHASNTIAAASFDPATIITRHWSNHWDTDPDTPTSNHPWNGMETQDGWTLNFETTYSETVVDGCGLVGMTIADQTLTASCRPVTVTEAQITTALRSVAMTPGDSLGALGYKMRWTYDTLVLESPNMGLATGMHHFGTRELRPGTLTWKARPAFSSGVRQPLITTVD